MRNLFFIFFFPSLSMRWPESCLLVAFFFFFWACTWHKRGKINGWKKGKRKKSFQRKWVKTRILATWMQTSGCYLIERGGGEAMSAALGANLLLNFHLVKLCLGWKSLCPFTTRLDSHPLNYYLIHVFRCKGGINFEVISTWFVPLYGVPANAHCKLSF